MSTHTAPKQSLHTTWKVDGKTPERLTRKINWAHNHIIQQITRWCSNIQSKYRWGLQVAKSIHHPIALLVTKRFWDHHWSRGPKRKLLIVLDYFLHSFHEGFLTQLSTHGARNDQATGSQSKNTLECIIKLYSFWYVGHASFSTLLATVVPTNQRGRG